LAYAVHVDVSTQPSVLCFLFVRSEFILLFNIIGNSPPRFVSKKNDTNLIGLMCMNIFLFTFLGRISLRLLRVLTICSD
jgi:hypothetical protein